MRSAPYYSMKKAISYLVGLVIVGAGLIPPIQWKISAPNESWPWFVLMSGFLAFYLLFIKANLFIKIVAIGGFLNCFLSTGSLISFTAYFSLIACCYFYIACVNVEEDIILKFLRPLILLHMFIFIVQFFGHDTLLNFSDKFCYGITGQHMQSASFIVILCACLFPYSVLYSLYCFPVSIVCNSSGAFLSASVGLIFFNLFKKRKRPAVALMTVFLLSFFVIWIVCKNKLVENVNPENGRFKVWSKTIELSNERLFTGYGIGMYQYLFPVIGKEYIKDKNFHPWSICHNDFLQFFFEVGWIGLWVIAAYMLFLMHRLFKYGLHNHLAALTMIVTNMNFAFPARMVPTVLLIILFLAQCERAVIHAKKQN
jgi:hypothetical protein